MTARTTAMSSWVRRRAALVAGAALLLVLAQASGAQAEARRTVAVLPLVVHALEEQEYLRAGLADMLASRLGRWDGVGVIRVDDPSTATVDAEAARAAARGVGADWVLFGSFTRFGDGASLDVRCLSVAESGEGGARSVFIQAGQLGEIIPRLDALAEKVAHHVTAGGTGGAPGDSAAPQDGVAALRAELGRLRARIERLEAVVPVDAAADAAGEPSPDATTRREGADLAGELR